MYPEAGGSLLAAVRGWGEIPPPGEVQSPLLKIGSDLLALAIVGAGLEPLLPICFLSQDLPVTQHTPAAGMSSLGDFQLPSLILALLHAYS